MKKLLSALAATFFLCLSGTASAAPAQIWTGSDAVQKCLASARAGTAGTPYLPRVDSRSSLPVQRVPAGGACLENAFVWEESASGNTRTVSGVVFVTEGFEYGTSPQGGFRMIKCNNPFTGLHLVAQAPAPVATPAFTPPACDASCLLAQKNAEALQSCSALGGQFSPAMELNGEGTCNVQTPRYSTNYVGGVSTSTNIIVASTAPTVTDQRQQYAPVVIPAQPARYVVQPSVPVVQGGCVTCGQQMPPAYRPPVTQQCRCLQTGQMLPAGSATCGQPHVTPAQTKPFGQNVGNVTPDARGGCSVLTPQGQYLPAPGMVVRGGQCVKG